MAITHNITQTWSVTGGTPVSYTFSPTGDMELNLDITVPASSTDYAVVIDFDITKMQSYYLVASTDVTLETNSSSAPADTVSLKANKALIWAASSGMTNAFATNVTAFYFTNSTTATTVQFRLLLAR